MPIRIFTIPFDPEKEIFSDENLSQFLLNKLDTIELIIEAIYTKDRLHILDKINLYMEKQRVLFRSAHDRRYISTRQFEYVAKAINEAGRMTGGWRKQILEKNR